MTCRIAILGLCLGVITAAPCAAQTRVAGVVVEASTGAPLAGANIVIRGTATGTIAGPDGRFQLDVPVPFPIELRFSFIGFDAIELELASPSQALRIELEPRILRQGGVVVSASRRAEKVTEAPASISVLYARDIETRTLSNPVESLRDVVGVDVNEQGVGNYTVTLRGRNLAFDTATYVMIDNRQVTTPGLSVVVFGRQPLNPDDIERVEVVRGPGSALYGPGVDAGVIHFITKNPFDHPGTVIRVAGGEQSSIRISGTHRAVLGERVGLKVTGLYSRAQNWAYNPADPDDAEFLGVFPNEIYSGVDGSLSRTIDGIDPDVESEGLAASLVWRPNDGSSLTADVGYARFKGISRFTLGEIYQDFPEAYGQVRYRSGNLFAQVFYLTARNDERSFLYRTGETLVLDNNQYEIQLQHVSDLPSLRTSLTYGGEFQHVTSETRGTVHGRFENDDAASIFGGYLQSQSDLSDRFALTLAGRVDRFDRLGQTVFSPRAGLVYKPSISHSVRLSYNRAFLSPTNLSLYTDLAVADLGPLDVRLIGGAVPITFDDPARTVSLFPGAEVWEGIDIPLQAAYRAGVAGLASQVPEGLLGFLESKIPQISGFSPGILFDIDRGVVSEARERLDPLRSQRTDMLELGYTGIFDRLFVSVSGYWAHKVDFESDVRVFGPLVVGIQLATDLVDGVSGVVSDAELVGLGMDRAEFETLISSMAEAVAAEPVGVVQPDQLPPSQRPQLAATFVNFGAIDYFGVELAATWFASDRLSFSASYAGLSRIDFDDVALGVPGTGERYSLNVAQHRFSAKADYVAGEVGPRIGAAFRYKQAFEGNFGELFAGTVDEQKIVDLSAGYAFGGGLSLNVTAQNLFDSPYRGFVGLPKIGRLVLASARYSF